MRAGNHLMVRAIFVSSWLEGVPRQLGHLEQLLSCVGSCSHGGSGLRSPSSKRKVRGALSSCRGLSP